MSKNESQADVQLRVQALVQTIDSLRATGSQSGDSGIVARAETFFQFLKYGANPEKVNE